VKNVSSCLIFWDKHQLLKLVAIFSIFDSTNQAFPKNQSPL
jgi:hypothetical protein